MWPFTKDKTSDSGYIQRYMPKDHHADRDGYVFLHQHRARKKIGRELRCDEVVHHIDGNKTNNKPSNLEVMTRSEHARLHIQERKKNK